MKPTTKAWLFGRAPVIIFGLIAVTWAVLLSIWSMDRPSYASLPHIGPIYALVFYTIIFSPLAFLFSLFGIFSPHVPKRWAWPGLVLNTPVMLYLVGYYPIVFAYRLFFAPASFTQ